MVIIILESLINKAPNKNSKYKTLKQDLKISSYENNSISLVNKKRRKGMPIPENISSMCLTVPMIVNNQPSSCSLSCPCYTRIVSYLLVCLTASLADIVPSSTARVPHYRFTSIPSHHAISSHITDVIVSSLCWHTCGTVNKLYTNRCSVTQFLLRCETVRAIKPRHSVYAIR